MDDGLVMSTSTWPSCLLSTIEPGIHHYHGQVFKVSLIGTILILCAKSKCGVGCYYILPIVVKLCRRHNKGTRSEFLLVCQPSLRQISFHLGSKLEGTYQ